MIFRTGHEGGGCSTVCSKIDSVSGSVNADYIVFLDYSLSYRPGDAVSPTGLRQQKIAEKYRGWRF